MPRSMIKSLKRDCNRTGQFPHVDLMTMKQGSLFPKEEAGMLSQCSLPV